MPSAPHYGSFAAVTLLVLGLLMLLARASQAMFVDPEDADRIEDGNRIEDADRIGDPDGDGSESATERDEPDSQIPATGAARIEQHADTGQTRAERKANRVLDDDPDENPWDRDSENPWGDNEAERDARRVRERGDDDSFSTEALLANVAFSQGVFGAAILGAAWLADLPLAALGVRPGDPWNLGLPALGVGVAVGIALYVANELSAKVADAAEIDYSESLRERLAPDSLVGWLVLLGFVLPVIAGFEELLFRAALVGAFAAGFGVSPWLLAVGSSVAFAVGHGAQGPGGVAVTGVLGFALAAAFVLTESLLVVVVAHYLVNALEFVVHEGLDIEWT